MNDKTTVEDLDQESEVPSDVETTPGSVDAKPPKKPRNHPDRRRKRRRRWHFGFWMLVWAFLGGSLFWLASLSFTGRVVQLPDWAVAQIEERLNREMLNGSITVQNIEFNVSPAGFPGLSLIDMSLRDDTGLEIAQVHRVKGAARPTGLLLGRIAPSRLSLTGALVTLRRRVNGDFDLSFGQKNGASGNLASVLDAIDEMFIKGPLAMTEELSADELTITLEDARTGRVWQVTDGRLKLTQGENFLDMTLVFDVFNQTDELAEVELAFRTNMSNSEASFGATFKNAVAADIAAQSPLLAFLSVIDAPISGALRSTINVDSEVSELAGTLELGAGALSPSSGSKPIHFDLAKIYIEYNSESERIDFTNFSIVSEYGYGNGSGHIYMQEMGNGWPKSLLGQFNISNALVDAPDLFRAPFLINEGAIDFRLRLNPFTLEIGQLALNQQGTTIQISGEVAASPDGWSLALDSKIPVLSPEKILELWPLTLPVKTHDWIEENIIAGGLTDLNASVRLEAGGEPQLSYGAGFQDVEVRAVKEMAPVLAASGYIVMQDFSFLVVTESGHVATPDGGEIEIAGTVFRVPNTRIKPTPASIDLHAVGSVTAILSILDAEPFRIFKTTDFGPDIATGNLVAEGRIDLVLKPKVQPKDVQFSIIAEATNVRSSAIIPGRVLTADSITITTDNSRLEITGDMRLGQAMGRGTWFTTLGSTENGSSRLEANIVLNQAFIDEFNIGLPASSISRQGVGQLSVDFQRGQAPKFELVSDLNRLGISIAALSWSKPSNRTGHLRVAGQLSTPPSVDVLEFDAPGLQANGRISIKPTGGLNEAVFSRVRLGGWLDAPVTFTGRGPNLAAAITIHGGSVDMRRAQFTGTAGSGGTGSGDAPIHLTLDRLTITEGIALTSLTGELDRQGGLSGQFSGRVNGGPEIQGVIAPQANGSAVRITSNEAGEVLRAAEVFQTARGGKMTLVLAPLAGEGSYDGDLTITGTRMVGASALAEIIAALSIVGLLEQLSEEGIAFSEVDARFRMTPSNVIISQASAFGASMGISLDGTYTLGSGIMDLAGVFSPLFILNGVGQLLTRKGEGLLGFTYTLKGTADDPKIAVNPLSIFTPGMFREIFRRPPPELTE